jgi:hypothetical protein
VARAAPCGPPAQACIDHGGDRQRNSELTTEGARYDEHGASAPFR